MKSRKISAGGMVFRAVARGPLLVTLVFAHPAPAAMIVADPVAKPAPAAIDLGPLTSVLPLDGGRRPVRRVSSAEATTIRRAVDYVFADKAQAERRRIFKSTLAMAATAPALRVDANTVRKRLVEYVDDAIGRAIAARRADDAAEVRRAARGALAALGWMYRANAGRKPSDDDVTAAQRWWFYRLAIGGQFASVGTFATAAHLQSVPLGMVAFWWFLINAAVNIGAGIDRFDGAPYIVDDVVGLVPFTRGKATRDAIDSDLARFWFELEERLARRDEWRAWVRVRPQSSDEDGIAADLREFLRALIGARSLESVCDDLLAPGALASPFR